MSNIERIFATFKPLGIRINNIGGDDMGNRPINVKFFYMITLSIYSLDK